METWRAPAVPRGGQRVVLLDPELPTVPQKQIDNACCITFRQDLTGSQTEACGEIIIYSEAYWVGNIV